MVWNFDIFSKNTALIPDKGAPVSYKDLDKFCKQFAVKMKPRSLVFSLCTNRIGSIMGYISFLQNGQVPLLLDAHLDRVLLDDLIETYSPKYLWIPSEMESEWPECSCINKIYGYSLLQLSYKKEYPLYSELAMLLTTSGSTGSPKLVRQSYRNLISNIESIVKYLEIKAADCAITMLPMSYTYGLSIINTHLWVGASIVVTEEPILQKRFWELLKLNHVTSINGVPYTYSMLNRLHFLEMNLPDIKTLTQAGGKLPPELHKKFAEFAQSQGKRFFVMYGQTEASPRMGYLPYKMSLKKCGCMGIAIPGGKFSLIDVDDSMITQPEIIGELVYQGENVTLGYAECGNDLILGDERQGILHTGDMAKFDLDNYYTIVGRKKRFLKIFGNRVNLDEIEGLIKGQFEGIWCACIGVDDQMYVFITEKSLLESIKKFLAGRTRINHTAFKMIYIPEIPKNESGKTQYKLLENYYDSV